MHSAGARLLLRAQGEGTARVDMNGDDLFALITALGWVADHLIRATGGPSCQPYYKRHPDKSAWRPGA
ncbi:MULTISPECIES: SbtR family transcriptional regulator [Rhizobium]|uniref:SbtR family transcriptional regulator n=1 Tax=Rhizobium TaxID=379 RepID=UPI0031BAA4E3